MTQRLGPLSNRTRSRVAMLMMLILSGCGYADYDMRLNETKKYWTYLDTIERLLAGKWTAPEVQMELRVPNMFRVMPPPQRIQRDDGTFEEQPDLRQPDYLSLTFPELYGAWEAPFSVLKTDGTTEQRKGYIYALCNYWELVGEKSADAGQFLKNFKTYMEEKLQIKASDERSETQAAGYPAYQPQVLFEVCDFKQKEIDGVHYNFTVYGKTSGSVIGVIVMVLPEGMDSPQNVSKCVPLMLASFGLAKSPPAAAQSRPGAGQAQPTGGAPAKAGF